jgi:hypothetical protein
VSEFLLLSLLSLILGGTAGYLYANFSGFKIYAKTLSQIRLRESALAGVFRIIAKRGRK